VVYKYTQYFFLPTREVLNLKSHKIRRYYTSKMKFSATLLMTIIGSIGATNAYLCPLGKVGECCISPTGKFCKITSKYSSTFLHHLINAKQANLQHLSQPALTTGNVSSLMTLLGLPSVVLRYVGGLFVGANGMGANDGVVGCGSECRVYCRTTFDWEVDVGRQGENGKGLKVL
jgi:hypothetical protein